MSTNPQSHNADNDPTVAATGPAPALAATDGLTGIDIIDTLVTACTDFTRSLHQVDAVECAYRTGELSPSGMADLLAHIASTQTALLDIVRQLAVGVGPYEYAGLIVNVKHLEWVVRHLHEAGAEFTRIAAVVQTQHPDDTI